MSDEKVRACALCEEQTISVLCLDCCKYYCSECSQFIHKKPKKKDHRTRTFINVTHIISTANATTCPLHEGNQLTLFCMDDNELCCEDCISEGRHEGHKVVKVGDGEEEEDNISLNGAKEEFTKAMESADALEKKIGKTIDDIQRENHATKERIKESFNEARMRLDAEEMCTHSQLDRVCTDAIGALKRIRDELALELENGTVLTNAADASDIDRVRELSILSMMGRERRGMDSVHDSVITSLCVDWDGYERRLSFTKSLISGVPVPSTIAFTAVNNGSVDVTWSITDAADNTPIRSDSMHFAVEVKKAAEEEDWAEKYSGTDQKCTVRGLDAATEYEVRVRCVVGAQGGEWAGPAAVRTKKVDVRIDSVILSEEPNQEVFDEKIIEWCGTNNFELLYRGSRDGFGGKNFHKHCNKRGRTLVLVKNNTGHVFGGFSSISWGSSGKWRKARGSFIFTLTNMHGTEPTKFALKNEDDESAVCHYGDGYGPVFGGGHDLLIYSDCNTNTGSYSNLPYVYNDTTGLGNSIFSSNASSNHFNVHEIEVFRVI